MRILRFSLILLLSVNLNAGVILLENTFSSGGSESSSSSFFLRQGVGQSVIGEDNSSSFVEQSGYYTWFLFVETGTGIEESSQGDRLTFSLGSPLPNPFKSYVRVIFSVPEKSRVNIKVFDVTGRVVRTLVDEIKKPGRYEINWYGRDDRGRKLKSGVYFLRMEGRDFRKVKKLILM